MANYKGSKFQDVYKRALSDDSFRQQLVTDPDSALRSVDIEPTNELLAAIRNAIDAVRNAQDIIGDEDKSLFVS